MSFRDLFERLDDRGVEYVVPRKYDDLPADTVDEDGDVDIVFAQEDFRAGVAACEAAGFERNRSGVGSRLGLILTAVRNPGTAVRRLGSDPVAVARAVANGGTPEGNPRHRNVERYRDGEMLDLRDGLAYRSPMDGTRIPVAPSVTEAMLARRRRRECFYVPTPADELAHVVPHCVFDKDGAFSAYYVDRCTTLFETVDADPVRRDRFRDLLDRIFFEAGDLVFDLVAERRYDEIRPALWRFSDY